jgi:hypothetical protein
MQTNGATIVTAKIKKGDWKFRVDIECAHDGKSCKMVCPLCNPSRFSSEKLLKALGHKCDQGRIIFRASDNMLCFEDPACSTAGSDEDFQQLLDQFLDAVRDSYPLWSGNVAAEQPPAPAPPAQAQPAPGAGQLKITLSGKEDLGGKYGDLTFIFSNDRDVLMIDADGETQGTFTLQNNRIAMSFYDGRVVYSGIVATGNITGTASNGKATWNFSVSR